LKRFENALRERSVFKRYFTRRQNGQVVETGPFYSMFNVGEYTFAPWKVVWREQSVWFTCAVAGPRDGRAVIPDHNLMLVACHDPDGAYYLSGALNADPGRLAIWTYVVSIQQATHILDNIRVPKFNAVDPVHQRLADLSQRAHALVQAAYDGDIGAHVELQKVE